MTVGDSAPAGAGSRTIIKATLCAGQWQLPPESSSGYSETARAGRVGLFSDVTHALAQLRIVNWELNGDSRLSIDN
jgi:hypothetical protein